MKNTNVAGGWAEICVVYVYINAVMYILYVTFGYIWSLPEMVILHCILCTRYENAVRGRVLVQKKFWDWLDRNDLE